MPEQREEFREAAIEAISDMTQHLPLDCELLVVACRPGKKDFDLVLPSPEANLNNALDALRRQGLSIDGDNAYKRDLCDSIVGAMVFGAQNSNPPPPGQWQQRFWEIARDEARLREELLESLTNLVGLAKLGAAQLGKYHAALAHAEAVIAKATQ